MNKEVLSTLGLTDDQIAKVIEEYKKSLDGNYVTKEVFNQKNDELKKAKEDIATRDEQIKSLEKLTKDNEELKTQIADIQKQNEEAKAQYEAELQKQKVSNAIRNEILSDNEYKAHDIDLVMGQLDMDAIKYSDNKLDGFKEQFDNLKQNKSFLFKQIETASNTNIYKGQTPTDSIVGDKAPVNEAVSYAKQLAKTALKNRGVDVDKK